jgi:hypothetical protein
MIRKPSTSMSGTFFMAITRVADPLHFAVDSRLPANHGAAS